MLAINGRSSTSSSKSVQPTPHTSAELVYARDEKRSGLM